MPNSQKKEEVLEAWSSLKEQITNKFNQLGKKQQEIVKVLELVSLILSDSDFEIFEIKEDEFHDKDFLKICKKVKELKLELTAIKKELEKEKGWQDKWINSNWYYMFNSIPPNDGERKIINELSDNHLTEEEKKESGKIIFEFERKLVSRYHSGRNFSSWNFRILNQKLFRCSNDSEVEKRAKQFFKDVVYEYYKNNSFY